mmetsp:Transcript_17337/g.27847  ORF Transcript_17337/g.27847 Transcript_17337/m.27847 type:complete len:86 (+) Transcript_17337:399-656(+)
MAAEWLANTTMVKIANTNTEKTRAARGMAAKARAASEMRKSNVNVSMFVSDLGKAVAVLVRDVVFCILGDFPSTDRYIFTAQFGF